MISDASGRGLVISSDGNFGKHMTEKMENDTMIDKYCFVRKQLLIQAYPGTLSRLKST